MSTPSDSSKGKNSGPEAAAASPSGHAHAHAHDCGCGHSAHGKEHQHQHPGHSHAHIHTVIRDNPAATGSPDSGAQAAVAAGSMAAAALADDPEQQAEFTRRFLLFLEMLVLVLWAVAMIWFYASGRIDKYLVGAGTFRIQVLIAGLALAVMAWFNWSMRALNAGCGHDHSHDGEDGGACCGGGEEHGHSHGHGHTHAHTAAPGDCCGHDHSHARDHKEEPHSCCGHDHGGHTGKEEHDPAHGHAHHHSHEGTVSGRGMGLLLLALSVSAAVALTPDDFSDTYKKNMLHAYASQPAAEKAMPEAYRIAPETPGQGLTLAQVEKVQPRNAEGNFEMDVMQLYYSGSDPEYAKVMKGQGVETIGQIVKDSADPAPHRWRVFVLQMTCCAADARPFSVPVEFAGPVPPDLQEMGWYKLKGKVDYTFEKNAGTSVLRAESAEPTLRPKDQRSLF